MVDDRCTALVDTALYDLVQCGRTDGRHHAPPHYYVTADGARVEWSDHERGYGIRPRGRWETTD